MKEKKVPLGHPFKTQKPPLGYDRHTLAIIKIPGHYKLDFLEAKEIILLTLLQECCP